MLHSNSIESLLVGLDSYDPAEQNNFQFPSTFDIPTDGIYSSVPFWHLRSSTFIGCVPERLRGNLMKVLCLQTLLMS